MRGYLGHTCGAISESVGFQFAHSLPILHCWFRLGILGRKRPLELMRLSANSQLLGYQDSEYIFRYRDIDTFFVIGYSITK
jgi:hypothetical protein